MVGKVDVVVVDTRVEDGDDDAFASITHIPDLVGIDHSNIVGHIKISVVFNDVFCDIVVNHIFHLIITNESYVVMS